MAGCGVEQPQVRQRRWGFATLPRGWHPGRQRPGVGFLTCWLFCFHQSCTLSGAGGARVLLWRPGAFGVRAGCGVLGVACAGGDLESAPWALLWALPGTVPCVCWEAFCAFQSLVAAGSTRALRADPTCIMSSGHSLEGEAVLCLPAGLADEHPRLGVAEEWAGRRVVRHGSPRLSEGIPALPYPQRRGPVCPGCQPAVWCGHVGAARTPHSRVEMTRNWGLTLSVVVPTTRGTMQGPDVMLHVLEAAVPKAQRGRGNECWDLATGRREDES